MSVQQKNTRKSSLPRLLGEVSFLVAQMLRYAPFREHWIAVCLLRPWWRWRPTPRRRAFRAGHGYRLIPSTDNLFYIAGIHEVLLLRQIHKMIKPGYAVWNIGANAGTSILWLHYAKPQKLCSYVAFEPIPDTVDMLKGNLSLNPS